MVELLTNGRLAESIRSEISRRDEACVTPHLLDIEVMSAIRSLTAGQRVSAHQVNEMIQGLAALPAERYADLPLLERIWELRHHFTASDATYIALAEELNAVFFTADEKLRKGDRAKVVLFAE